MKNLREYDGLHTFIIFAVLNTLFFYLIYSSATMEDFSSYFAITDSLMVISVIYVIYVIYLRFSENPFNRSKSYAFQILFFIPLFSLAAILGLNISVKKEFIFAFYAMLLLVAFYRFIKYKGEYMDENPTSDFTYIKNEKFVELVYFVLVYAMIVSFLLDRTMFSIILLIFTAALAIFFKHKKLKTKLDDFKYTGFVFIIIYFSMTFHVNVIYFSVAYLAFTAAYFLYLRDRMPVKN